MADEPDAPRQLPNAQGDIHAKGPEFLVGFDVPRTWASGAQVFVTSHTTSIVFREQILMDVDGELSGLVRNVSSVIMPTEVAKEFAAILQTQLAALNGSAED